MMTIPSQLRRWRQILETLSHNPRWHRAGKLALYALGAFLLSAASLSHAPIPLALGLLLWTSGWEAVSVCAGGLGGYLLFWGAYGLQGAVWMLLGLVLALGPAQWPTVRQIPLLPSALGTLIAALTGLAFQIWGLDDGGLPLYLLRMAVAAGSAWLFPAAAEKEPFALWLLGGVGVLALAQILPLPWLNLGCAAAAAIAAAGSFPAAAMAGLALDLAQVARVPMTAVLCLIYLVRLIPGTGDTLLRIAPAFLYLLVCALTGTWDLAPVPALFLGGLLSRFLPGQPRLAHRRGETGGAQVRLEMAAEVLAQTQRLLLETPEPDIDEEALVLRAVERACGSCPARKHCRDRDSMAAMSPLLLHRTLLSPMDLTASCRKSSRVLGELHRSQEQLRSIRASRDRQAEYRSAMIQQYSFLSQYLRDLSDSLSRRDRIPRWNYSVRVSVYANRQAGDNGDRCLWFPGVGEDYFVLLCDGMGTGLGAIDEGRTAAGMLRDLLAAGFPPEHALRSLNSLCALRDRAGAVTVDLARIRLDTGRVTLYKWGAAPSFLLKRTGAEKIGTAGPPPGLSVQEATETVSRLSLRVGETLLMLSDGVEGEEVRRHWDGAADTGAGELATRLLEQEDGTDDATAVIITLEPEPVVT
ncbi:MAG: SpoIIE family protein phosphatase [Oscillospiraceae bacterium]|nr:SpoIIE family protein phosphatase [Oscillospiraceae bacterium]